MKLRHTLVFMIAGLSFGCAEDVDSTDIRTGGMYAIYEAVSDGSGETDISAQLRVGGDDGTFIELKADDELTVTTDEDEATLRHIEKGNRHYYESTIDGDEGGLEIQIALSRGDLDDDAPDSFATLPKPFEAALEDKDLKDILRGNDVFIVWDNEANGKMEWSLEGDCVKSESGSTDDDGSLTIKAEDVEVWESDQGEACDVTVTLDRIKKGETDTTFEEGGEFYAIQRRSVTFSSMPADDEVAD